MSQINPKIFPSRHIGDRARLYASLVFVALGATACASHTGVVPLGQDNFMIAKQQSTGFPGLGNMKAEIISEASAYCAGKGKEFLLTSTEETQPPYIFGNYPRSEIQFKCNATN